MPSAWMPSVSMLPRVPDVAARRTIEDSVGRAALGAVLAGADPEHRAKPGQGGDPGLGDDPGDGRDPDQGARRAPTSGREQPAEPGRAVDRTTVRTAVRYTLQLLAQRAPGYSVEVRVPPAGAVQAVPGPVHRRGTPSAVVEMDPATWLALATGSLRWEQARATGLIRASGERADLSPWLPLVRMP